MKNVMNYTFRKSVLEITVKIIICSLMYVYCISMLLPLVWMLYSSVKGNNDFVLNAFGLPKQLRFSNYSELLSKFSLELISKKGELVRYGLPSMLMYSLIWSCGRNFVAVFFNSIIAYIMARYKFFGREFLFAFGIFVMVTPLVGTLPAAMSIAKTIGTYNNMFMLIITNAQTSFTGFNFLLLYGAYKALPKDYSEAAFIDGAGHFRVYYQIMLPMMLSTCTVLFVLGFLNSWNDYTSFVMWLPSYPTLAIGMYIFQYKATEYAAGTPVVLAGFVLVCIPTVTIYFLAQKIILTKYSVGGLKE